MMRGFADKRREQPVKNLHLQLSIFQEAAVPQRHPAFRKLMTRARYA
jgi:hypothetical protein